MTHGEETKKNIKRVKESLRRKKKAFVENFTIEADRKVN